MNKLYTLLFALMAVVQSSYAGNFITPNNGSAYTFSMLSKIEGSGVTSTDGKTFVIADSITIQNNDKFVIESGITVRFCDAVCMDLYGECNFVADARVLFTKNADTDVPGRLNYRNDYKAAKFVNIDFEYVGIKGYSISGMTVENCTFRYFDKFDNVKSPLNLGGDSAPFYVRNCVFEMNPLSAIIGGANVSNPIVVENCEFIKNGQDNRNYPQLNLTVADSVIVRNNVLIGDSTKNYVGGLVVSNMLGLTGSKRTVIEGNAIKYHRYGMQVLGLQTAEIINNNFVDNRFEKNAMNGGSGISIYGTGHDNTVTIKGNYIAGNLWGVTVIKENCVNMGNTTNAAVDYNPGGNVFANNGNGGVLYDLYNNSADTVYAQGNHWNVAVQDSVSIEGVVTHKADNASLGLVIFMPALENIPQSIGSTNANTTVKPMFNGATGSLMFGNNGTNTVAIFSIDGRLIGTYNNVSESLNLSQLTPGCYVARVRNANGTAAIKFAK
jgi:hypothetical protein